VIAIADEAPVQVASVAPLALPVPALPAPAAVVAAATGEPANARQALEAVAEDPLAPIPRADSMLGYASAVENAPASMPEPKLQTASLTSGPAMPGQKPAAGSKALPYALADKSDPLASFSRPEIKTSLPIYDGAQSAYRGAFSTMQHPDQTSGDMVFTSPSFIVVASFDRRPYGSMSSVGFSGVALTRLPVRVFNGEQSFAAAR
jgi:hypothetical protein